MNETITRCETITGLPALTREALVGVLATTPPAVLAERFLCGDLERASVATGYDLAQWWCSIVGEDGELVAFVRFDEGTGRVVDAVCCAAWRRAEYREIRDRLTALPSGPIILYRGEYAE